MEKVEDLILLPEETIIRKIYRVRGNKVMLDFERALLYGVAVKRLKESVRRNIKRFPVDFLFDWAQSYHQSLTCLKCAIGTSYF